MLRIYAVLGVSFFAASLSFADTLNKKMKMEAQLLADEASSSELAYNIVESLTTEVGPRLAGTEAEERARKWAVKKLKHLGFENVHVEPFKVPKWIRGVEKAEILHPFPQPLQISTLGGSVATPADGVSGEIISFPTLTALQEVKDGSLKGKIVFIDELMTRTQDGSGYSQAVKKRRTTAVEARRAGAVAALIRSVGTSTHRFPHTGQMLRVTAEQLPSVPTAALSAPDADQIKRALSRNKKIIVRLVLRPEHLPPSPSGNVIAEIRGSKYPEQVILLGAHLDSWDLGTGAIDDGAGVGIIISAAHILKEKLGRAPQRTIRIVLFGSEEVGLVGAKHYTEKHKDELENHIIAVESDFGADVIWRFDTKINENALPLAQAIANELAIFGVNMGKNNARPGPDLKYLGEAGVPYVNLKQNGTDYFDLHHTANDTLDKIDPKKLNQNVAVYTKFIYFVSEVSTKFRSNISQP